MCVCVCVCVYVCVCVSEREKKEGGVGEKILKMGFSKMRSKEIQDKAMLRWYYMCVFGMPYMGWYLVIIIIIINV